jgi:hypothetical protein
MGTRRMIGFISGCPGREETQRWGHPDRRYSRRLAPSSGWVSKTCLAGNLQDNACVGRLGKPAVPCRALLWRGRGSMGKDDALSLRLKYTWLLVPVFTACAMSVPQDCSSLDSYCTVLLAKLKQTAFPPLNLCHLSVRLSVCHFVSLLFCQSVTLSVCFW